MKVLVVNAYIKIGEKKSKSSPERLLVKQKAEWMSNYYIILVSSF